MHGEALDGPPPRENHGPGPGFGGEPSPPGKSRESVNLGATLLDDTEFHARIEGAIAEVEQTTSAELVLVLAASSGSYRDADLSAGALLSALGLIFMVFAPLPVHEILAVTHTLLLFLVGTMASRRLPSLRRLRTPDNRRREQTKVEASAAFHDEGVAATRERNGLLLYLSLLEQRLELVPDTGLEGKVATARWNEVLDGIRHLRSTSEWREAIVPTIRALGPILGEAYPPGADNPDEIPNRPRIRQ